jgi:AP2-associated kinase
MERSLPPSPDDDTNIQSNVDFLRAMEEPEKKDKASKHHLKRGSLSSLGAGTKNILAGKFGDAFKRFEGNTNGPPQARTPSPLKDLDRERHDLTPIAGSEAVDGRSDDGQPLDWDDMTPEMRREQEAQMLAQEEARVAAAQAEYRQRVGQRAPGSGPPPLPPKSIGGVSRVASIQNKVQSLLDESNQPVARTAQGYGHYADAKSTGAGAGGEGKPAVPKKTVSQVTGSQQQQQQQQQLSRPPTSSGSINTNPAVEPSATGRTTTASVSTAAGRPMAPPKPNHLNTLPTGARPPSPTKQQQLPLMPNPAMANSRGGISSPKTRGGQASPAAAGGGGGGESREALLAVDLPGGGGSALLRMTAAEKDDYVRDFQKRFPSLGAIEMVERDFDDVESGGGGHGGGRGGR